MWLEIHKLLAHHRIPVKIHVFKTSSIESFKRQYETQLVVGVPPSIRRTVGVNVGDNVILIGPTHFIGWHVHTEAIVEKANEGNLAMTGVTRKKIGIDEWKGKTVEVQLFKRMIEVVRVIE